MKCPGPAPESPDPPDSAGPGSRVDRRPPPQPAVVAALLAAVLAALVLEWLVSDLWFDEIITLSSYALGPDDEQPFWRVFRVYPVPNNHILYSAVLWAWVRLTAFSTSEWLLRLPSLVFAALAPTWVVCSWSPIMGRRRSGLIALLLVTSPIYTAFSWQLRGYALTFLLTILALDPLVRSASDCPVPKRSRWLQAAALLGLPLVVPTNALLNLVILATQIALDSRPWRARLRGVWLPLTATILGSGYYLTLGPQFHRALAQTTGWPHRGIVVGHWILALLLHLMPLLVALAFLWNDRRTPPAPRAMRCGKWLVGLGLASLIVVVGSRSPAPYPRAFLGLLPLLTVAVCLWLPLPQALGSPRAWIALLLFAVVWHRGMTTAADALTERRMQNGHRPQNLLQQHYRGSTDASAICHRLRVEGQADKVALVCSFHDFPAFYYYWDAITGQPRNRVIDPREAPAEQWSGLVRNSPLIPLAVALCETEAHDLLHTLAPGSMPVPQLLFRQGRTGVYSPADPASEPRTP